MTAQDFEFIYRLVRERSAIVLETGKEYLVESRLMPIVRQIKLASIAALVEQLRTGADPALRVRVVEAMLTTETSFFRDHHPFETLRTEVIPDLIRRRRDARRLDIWCAASSTGQEPYSLAILIQEHFSELASWQINFLATDLSTEVLRKAREGRYSQLEVNRGLPIALLLKYFRQHGTDWELNPDVRRMVEFRELNLDRLWPPMPPMDIVLIRNVMIYFDIPTKKEILSRIARLLRPDGYLVLGGAETTLNLDDSYRRVEHLKGGFYQLVK